ncbi:transglutaminase domain-containing protein [bacterium]|nr:transglutaminase domain-containing protein [bacterium]
MTHETDEWFSVTMLGARAGWMHVTREWAPPAAGTQRTERAEMRLRVNSPERGTASVAVTSEVTIGPRGFVAGRFEMVNEGQRVATAAERAPGGFAVSRVLNAATNDSFIPSSVDVVHAAVDGFMLKERGWLVAGATGSAVCFSLEAGMIETQTIAVGPVTTFMLTGAAMQVHTVTIISSALGSRPVRTFVTGAGATLEQSMDVMTLSRCGEHEARAGDAAVSISSYVPIDGTPPARTRRHLRLLLTQKRLDRPWRDIIRDTAYQTVSAGATDAAAVIELHPVQAWSGVRCIMLRGDAGAAGCTGDMARYTLPSRFIESAAPAIAREARRAAGGASSDRERLERTVGHVDAMLRKSVGGTLFRSALETMRAGEGDCTEHATLCVALLRAAGVPSRVMCGLLAMQSQLAYHAWGEACIGGVWVPFDATRGLVGLPAEYIALGELDDPFESVAVLDQMLSLIGNITARYE